MTLLVVASGFGTASADEEYIAVRGESITISVMLLQNGTFGDPVPEQNIEFYDQTNNLLLGTDITNATGIASIDWNIPIDHILGPTIINATFRGNESIFLAPSYQSIILNILASTEIVLHNVPLTLAPGDTLSFSVNLQDDTSNPIDNRNLSVYRDDILLATAMTNSTGGISFSIHCNSSWSILGENIVRIVHEQDIACYYERSETQFTVEIQRLPTSIQSNFSLNSILLDDSFNLELELTSADGGISADLEVLLDGNHLTVATTDISGNDTINLVIDDQFSLGPHSLTVFYNGSERYTETSCIIDFDVISPAIFDVEISSPIVIGQNTEVMISLCDVLGRPIDTTINISDISSGIHTSVLTPQNTTIFDIEFTFSGPVGSREISLEIENPFITNRTILLDVVIWSRPELTLLQINTLNFASPNQELTFIVQLTDWSGNVSYQSLQLLLDNEIIHSVITGEDGIAVISTIAPSHEGVYNYSVVSPVNTTRYELLTKLDYPLTVSISIPVLVELDHYEVIPPLQTVTVYLQVKCLNGSLIEGIQINIIWLSIENNAMTQQGGLSVVHLPVPEASGIYTLHYTIEQNRNLAPTEGTIDITISLVDILTSQGIGITGFVIGILSSFTIVAIPIVRQRYLSV